jgi:hypothetical protein
VWLEGLGKLKKFSDLIGTQTRDLPACSIVPQPITLPHYSIFCKIGDLHKSLHIFVRNVNAFTALNLIKCNNI